MGEKHCLFHDSGMLAMFDGSFILKELTCLDTGLNLNSVIVLSARILPGQYQV
jgi:hypothetical protein